MIKAYKVELKLNNAQKHRCNRWMGTVRYMYNLYVQFASIYYRETTCFLSAYDFSKAYNNSKRPKFVLDVPSKSVKQAMINGNTAFKHFFDHKANHPKLHRRQDCESFYVIEHIKVERHRIKLPKLGWLQLKQYGYIPTDKRIRSATVIRELNHYFVSVLVDEDIKNIETPDGDPLGIDVGLKNLAITSDGRMFESINRNPRIRKLTRRLKRLQRELCRRRVSKRKHIGFGRNYTKTLYKIKVVRYKIANKKHDLKLRVIQDILKSRPSYISIEDLNIKGMMKNRHLSSALQSQGLYEFMTMLKHECRKRNIEVRVVDRFYPSSQLCSVCGYKNPNIKNLNIRQWDCPNCSTHHNRDINAAINLRNAKEYEILDID